MGKMGNQPKNRSVRLKAAAPLTADAIALLAEVQKRVVGPVTARDILMYARGQIGALVGGGVEDADEHEVVVVTVHAVAYRGEEMESARNADEEREIVLDKLAETEPVWRGFFADWESALEGMPPADPRAEETEG